ncbi:MAG TPA: hypothetical protein VG826_34950 [Pirellulales bacterium]|nr:hypothetical protein [Pirellulales bacterium]
MPDAAKSPISETALLERVSPAVRKLLVTTRIRAMEQGSEGVTQSLQDSIGLVGGDHPRDAIALAMLKAELLHLDYAHGEAIAVMAEVVSPRLPVLTPKERFAVEQNRSDLQLYVGEGGADLFYNIVDQKRLVEFDWLDFRQLFSAKQGAERGKHYETLPILWQQHRRAYLYNCWRAQQWTNQLLANECVALKAWEDALHHAILAQHEDIMPLIAEGLFSTGNSELIEKVVSRLLMTANLRRHFIAACRLLRALADAIPEGVLPAVGQWLLKRAGEISTCRFGPNHVSEAWKTIAAVAQGFPVDLSRSAIDVAISHPAWTTRLPTPNAVILERAEIVKAMVPLAWRVPREEIPALATTTYPLLTDRPQVSDYDEVANLLCHLADRGGPSVRDQLAGVLYPPGRPVSRVLAQVADQFGKGDVFDSAAFQKLADQVVQEIRGQVQWIETGQEAEPLAEQIMAFTSVKPAGKLQVAFVGLTGLHALARHRTKLDEATRRKLLDAVLDMAQHRDNFCVNRQGLLHALIDFADLVPETARRTTERVLVRIARGQVDESLEYAPSAQVDDPLNPNKYNLGRPDDVQAVALVAIAVLAFGNAGAMKRAGQLLEDALCDARPAIRRAAYAAARRLTRVSTGVIVGVLAGLRDPDPKVAITAFAALADQTGWHLNRNHWRVFLMAARLAQKTGDANLRRHVAVALVAWAAKCPRELRGEHGQLLTAFARDICASVRSAVNCSSDTD